MSKNFTFSAPAQQISFAFILKKFRATYLQNALFETVKAMKIAEIDKQLARYVLDRDLALMAQYGLRGELLFAVPVVLEQNPYLLGYYRLLMGYSQKEFYSRDKGFGTAPFKAMETKGKIAKNIADDIPDLCMAFCRAASTLLHGIEALEPTKELLDDLVLLTVGPQMRGGANNQRGASGIVQVFEIIRQIVAHAVTDVRENSIEVMNATARKVLIEFASDPDITIREEMLPGNFRNIAAIEIKSGTDVSNIHNRIGEAEKSHQKARKCGYTECWTIVNVGGLDIEKARSESPSTDRFYSLRLLATGEGKEFDDFRRRIASLASITLS